MNFRFTRFAIPMLTLAAAMLMGAATLASTDGPGLKIGDPAPALDPMVWIKGEPVTAFKPGHVYVVEFWATWCAPCNAVMPELSELQRKHAGRLTVIGVNARETEHGSEATVESVRRFVERKGENMDYTVVMDDPEKKTIFRNWMIAAGSYGIPTSFVVDGQGRLVWVGHPTGPHKEVFKAAVEQALAGNSDLEAARKMHADVVRMNAPRVQKFLMSS